MTSAEVADHIRPWQCFFNMDAELPAILHEFAGRKKILEIGTYKGATSAALALAMPDAQVTTIDLPDPSATRYNPQASSECGVAIRGLGLDGRIEQVRLDSSLLIAWAGNRRFDGVFVDADHSTAAVQRDLMSAANLLEPGGVILVHDYTDEKDGQQNRPWWTIDVFEGVRLFLSAQSQFKLRRLPGWLAAIEA